MLRQFGSEAVHNDVYFVEIEKPRNKSLWLLESFSIFSSVSNLDTAENGSFQVCQKLVASLFRIRRNIGVKQDSEKANELFQLAGKTESRPRSTRQKNGPKEI